MEHLDQITNPIIKDWSIVLSLTGIGIFVLIKWLVATVTGLSDKSKERKAEEVSRIEQFLNNELSLSRAEKLELTNEIKRIQSEHMAKTSEASKLRLQLRQAITRIRYLETLLYENQIKIIPAVENYDD